MLNNDVKHKHYPTNVPKRKLWVPPRDPGSSRATSTRGTSPRPRLVLLASPSLNLRNLNKENPIVEALNVVLMIN